MGKEPCAPNFLDASAMGIAEAKEHRHFPRLWRDLATNADASKTKEKFLDIVGRFLVYSKNKEILEKLGLIG